jgi:hypothetical protein
MCLIVLFLLISLLILDPLFLAADAAFFSCGLAGTLAAVVPSKSYYKPPANRAPCKRLPTEKETNMLYSILIGRLARLPQRGMFLSADTKNNTPRQTNLPVSKV